MGRRRMKTNEDEKESIFAETTATYALGVFCQLVNPYISGVDHHKKGFMKDFFDAVLEDDGLRNPLPQHREELYNSRYSPIWIRLRPDLRLGWLYDHRLKMLSTK